MIRLLAVLLLVAPLAAAPVPKEVRKHAPPQGSWKVMKIDQPAGGESIGMKHYWDIGANGDVRFTGPGERPEEIRFRLTFHPETTPKQVEYRTPRMEKPYLGIYESDGENLKLAIDFNGGPRPENFERNGQFYTYHFRRARDSK